MFDNEQRFQAPSQNKSCRNVELGLCFISIQTSFRDSKLFRSGISFELVVYRMNINLLGQIQNCF